MTRFTKIDAKIYASIVHSADMLIVQRLPLSTALAKIFAHLNALGKLVIYEIDDDLMHLNPKSNYARRAPKDYRNKIRNCILASQAVQCSTKVLAEKISKFHPEVVVLENQLETIPVFAEKHISRRPIIIGYAAGEHHLSDWKTIQNAYNQIIAELEAAGHKPETWIVGDKNIFDSVKTRNKKYVPLLPRPQYFQLLKQIDISIIPLEDNGFNRCKSDIKYLESAAHGAAVLASDVIYSNCIKHNATGLLFNNNHEFIQHLRELILHPQQINRLAGNAHRYVSENRRLSQHIKTWENTYCKWFKNRENLLPNTSQLHKLQ